MTNKYLEKIAGNRATILDRVKSKAFGKKSKVFSKTKNTTDNFKSLDKVLASKEKKAGKAARSVPTDMANNAKYWDAHFKSNKATSNRLNMLRASDTHTKNRLDKILGKKSKG